MPLRKNAILLCAVLSVLTACSSGGPVGPTGTITTAGAVSNGYSFKCSGTPSVNDWSAELDAVHPQNTIGGSLVALLPQVGPDPRSACTIAMFEARIEAMRRAKLFDSVEIRRNDSVGLRPQTEADGFWIWSENGALVASYGRGIRMILPVNPQRLDGWVAGLTTFFVNLKKTSDQTSAAINLSTVGLSNYYGYRGVEYLDLNDVRSALLAQADLTAAKTRNVAEIGRTALVMVPTEKAVIATWTASAQKIPNMANNLGVTLGISSYASILGQAKAIQRSGLFRQTAVQETDVTDPDIGGYDAIIWMKSTDTGKWYLRRKGRTTVPFKALVTEEPDKWISVVTDALSKTPTDMP